MLSHSGYNDCMITGHAERAGSAMAPIGGEYMGNVIKTVHIWLKMDRKRESP